MARRELVNALEHRQRRLDETKRKVLLERREIDRRTSIVARQKRFDLGGAREASIILPVVERLLAQMIARHQQAPAARIPECECEHAAKVLEEPIAVALIERDDDFAIAVREEDMSASLEIAPELSIVVDLAIGDEADRTVVAAQRLCAAPQVDDRKPPMTQCRELIVIDTLAVGASMSERIEHAAYRCFAAGTIIGEKRCDTAHGGARGWGLGDGVTARARSACDISGLRRRGDCAAPRGSSCAFGDHIFENLLVARGARIDEKLLHALAIPCSVSTSRVRIGIQREQRFFEALLVVQWNDVARFAGREKIGLTATVITDDR